MGRGARKNYEISKFLLKIGRNLLAYKLNVYVALHIMSKSILALLRHEIGI